MAELPPLPQLARLINGFQISQALHVAVTLGVADLITDGEPRDVATLAADADAEPDALYRLLRALAAEGVFREEDSRHFTHTPMSLLLRSSAPLSPAAWAANIGRPYFWNAWGHLLHGVRTGENVFSSLHGTDAWSYRAAHPDDNVVFNAAMTSMSRMENTALLAAYDFSRFHCIVDIGGGQGALLAAILQRYPDARGVLFDQPHVVEAAGALLRDTGVDGRCEVVAGDMFASVPAGGDAYTMRAILHDWDDDRCTSILRVVRAAMAPESRLLVLDQVVGEANEGAPTKFSDLNMLVMLGGRERTETEFAALFATAALRLVAVTRTAGMFRVIEAAPV